MSSEEFQRFEVTFYRHRACTTSYKQMDLGKIDLLVDFLIFVSTNKVALLNLLLPLY